MKAKSSEEKREFNKSLKRMNKELANEKKEFKKLRAHLQKLEKKHMGALERGANPSEETGEV